MSQAGPPSDPVETPILNQPYDAPQWHWSLDVDFRAVAPASGRRPSGAYLPVPKPTRRKAELPLGDQQQSCQEVEPHKRINRIRDAVEAWRVAGFPGATNESIELVEHWNQPEREGVQPYFCQRDAVETAILPEGGGRQSTAGIRGGARRAQRGTQRRHTANRAQARYRDWQDLRDGDAHPLAGEERVLPGLPADGSQLDHPRPIAGAEERERALRRSPSPGDRTRFRVTVLNFQAWQRRTGVGVEGAITKAQKAAIGLDAEHFEKATTESEEEMIDRLLSTHRGRGRLCVMNDEAHHCYNGERAGGSRIAGESAREETEAMMWFGALRGLHRRGRVAQVYDLSATPMWLHRPTASEPSVLFPWTVSDFPLVDAIETGLVKIPRVPIRDDSGAEVPAFRNLHTAVKDSLGKTPLPPKANSLPRTVDDAITRMMGDYERIRADYEPRGITPILIVVADTIANAERLFAELGGWRNDGEWVPGRFSILSNIDEAKGGEEPATDVAGSLQNGRDGEGRQARGERRDVGQRRGPRLGPKAERCGADGGGAGSVQHGGEEGQARRATAVHRLRGDADGRLGRDWGDACGGLPALRFGPPLRAGGGPRPPSQRGAGAGVGADRRVREHRRHPFPQYGDEGEGRPRAVQGEVGGLHGPPVAGISGSSCHGSGAGGGISRVREPA